jgi:glycerophosphoryl diester phosphodiesterase
MMTAISGSTLSMYLAGALLAGLAYTGIVSTPHSAIPQADGVPQSGFQYGFNTDPIVIGAHDIRDVVPEHTLASYFTLIMAGADYIDVEVVMTKDGQLIARHNHELSTTTDIAERQQFTGRKNSKLVDGERITGWFTEDLTLREIKQLRATSQALPSGAQPSPFDGKYQIPTLQEVIQLVQSLGRDVVHRDVGLYLNVRQAGYFAQLGLSLEQPLVEILSRNGYQGAQAKVRIQSPDQTSLKKLRALTSVSLVQKIPLQSAIEAAIDGNDYGCRDSFCNDIATTSTGLTARDDLTAIAGYAEAVALDSCRTLNQAPTEYDTKIAKTGSNCATFIAAAHAAGLQVYTHLFTTNVAHEIDNNPSVTTVTETSGELKRHFAAGFDGIFTGQTESAVRERKVYLADVSRFYN